MPSIRSICLSAWGVSLALILAPAHAGEISLTPQTPSARPWSISAERIIVSTGAR